MLSPISGQPMREVDYEGATIYTCEQSGGEFVGPEALAHIVRTRDERFPNEMHAALADLSPRSGIDEKEPHRELNCPACGGAMNLTNYGMDSGVHVDRCASCGGMWLDHDELEHIQVLMERWREEAPARIADAKNDLEEARLRAVEQTNNAFSGWRFSFVNAVVNRLLDAA